MSFKKWGLAFTAVSVAVIVACTKDVSSRVNFIFKDPQNATVAANVMGQDISWEQLNDGVTNEIYEAQMKVYDLQMDRLRGIALQRFIDADPRKKDLTNDEYLEKFIANNVSVSTAEIDAFSKERNIPAEHLNAEMKERIKDFLLKDKKRLAIEKWIADKTKNQPIVHHIVKPQRPTFDVDASGAPFFGKENAKVTIVEFSDFQCPFCAKGAERMNEIKKKYGNDVKVVFRNFPLPFHSNAKIAAEASFCAHEQSADKFWKFHDALFAGQDSLDRNGLVAKSKAVGLDQEKFTQCLDSGKFRERVEADMEIGKKVGVKSTPTFYVNGMLVSGAQPIEVFSEIIDEELAK